MLSVNDTAIVQRKKRKEVTLDDETIALLRIQAEREVRKLKNYMEHVLRERARDVELTDERPLQKMGISRQLFPQSGFMLNNLELDQILKLFFAS